MNQKRSLTSSEITDILSVIPLNNAIPRDIAISVRNKNINSIKKDLEKIKIYPAVIPDIKKEIERQYYKTMIQPGESVGIITAQSIGERQTQSTLNSVDWTEKVLYFHQNKVHVSTIGSMIDSLLDKNPTKIIHYPENKTEYLDLEEYYTIPSCDRDGNMTWLKIEAVTRHLPCGDLVKVTTQTGRTVMASQSKSFIVWNGYQFVPTNGSDIEIGNIIPITKRIDKPCNETIEKYISYKNKKILIDNALSTFIGAYLGKGVIIRDEDFKLIVLRNTPLEIKKTILFFCSKYSIGYNISSQNILDSVIEINSIFLVKFLLKFSFDSIPQFMFLAHNKYILLFLSAFYSCKNIISGQVYSENLMNGIYFLQNYFGEEKEKFQGIPKNDNYPTDRDVYFDKIISIEKVPSTTKYVYDFTVENTRTFSLYNGFGMYDTFHSAGMSVKTVITGVPRFSELLNATKDPKAQSCYVYFNKKFENMKDIRNEINHSLIQLDLDTLKTDISIHLSTHGNDDWYELFEQLYSDEYKNYDSYIRFTLNLELLYEYSISLEYIANKLEEEYSDIKCVFSPDEYGIIDLYLDTNNIENENQYLDEIDIKMSYIEDDVIPNISKEILTGIKDIKNIFLEKRNDEWIIETEGSNLKAILGHDMIDKTRTISNNMWEIYETLGIEAARNFLIEEFSSVVSSDGTYVNDSHIKLLVDIMTYSGSITSISRYGMKRENCGPLAKASFEESLDNFMKAGIYGEKENIKGVSASVMLGKVPKIGSGLCDILIDIDRLPNISDDNIKGLKPQEISIIEDQKILKEIVKEKDENIKGQQSLEEELKRMKLESCRNKKEILTKHHEKNKSENKSKKSMIIF